MAAIPTAEEISKDYDFTGKTAIVTGANTGIGKETARVLALRNAHVVLAVRSVEKGEQAKKEILESIGQEKAHLLEVMQLDLSSLASVREFVKNFNARKSTDLHFLVNNAGVVSETRTQTADGFETNFGVNHLAHFLLTLLLVPNLKKSAPSRVVVVSSNAHVRATTFDVNDYNLTRLEPYDTLAAYNVSKLYNVLFANELNRRLEGTGVVVNSLHPGLIKTDLLRGDENKAIQFLNYVSTTYNVPILTIPQGAATTLFVVGSKEGATGGQYFRDVSLSAPAPHALDAAAGKQLWEISEKLANVTLD